MLGAPVFLGGFTAGAMVLGEPREFFHLLRNFSTYRKEFKAYKAELYYSWNKTQRTELNYLKPSLFDAFFYLAPIYLFSYNIFI